MLVTSIVISTNSFQNLMLGSNWINNNFEFDPIRVNKKFQQLNAPYNNRDESEFVDYNNWVDDILNMEFQTAPTGGDKIKTEF